MEEKIRKEINVYLEQVSLATDPQEKADTWFLIGSALNMLEKVVMIKKAEKDLLLP